MCPTCESPDRVLWTFGNYPKLVTERVGNWIALERCQSCGARWCSVPHEPYGGYTFLTAWPYDVVVFDQLNAQHGARVLHEWHDAVIRESWQSLSAEEIVWVEEWRDRSYRHYNPIDRGPDVKPPWFVRESSEISRYVEEVNEFRRRGRWAPVVLVLLALVILLFVVLRISK